MKDSVQVSVKGHVKITDDLGNVHLDQDNAIHPENMARVIARALANEYNYYINRIAFGNGGTEINAAYTITYNTPNDGQPPDTNTWNSRLYHETYSEIVNSTGWPPVPGDAVPNPLLGSDPGSADANTGVRPGGGAVPADDPPTIPHVSGPGVVSVENGLTSNVVVTCVLNAAEPTGEYLTDVLGPIENTSNPSATSGPTDPNANSFTFDEIGLYTSGAQPIGTNGYQQVNVGNQTALTQTTLQPGTQYNFHIQIDGGAVQTVSFTTPIAGGSGPVISGNVNNAKYILYGDLVTALTTGQASWNIFVSGNSVVGTNFLGSTGSVNITNDGTFNAAVSPAQTFGYLTFSSASIGPTSNVVLSAGGTGGSLNDLFANINTGGASFNSPSVGTNAGVQNDVLAPANEQERLLAHLIFTPVLKAANRTFVIVYTLTVSVARTPSV